MCRSGPIVTSRPVLHEGVSIFGLVCLKWVIFYDSRGQARFVTVALNLNISITIGPIGFFPGRFSFFRCRSPLTDRGWDQVRFIGPFCPLSLVTVLPSIKVRNLAPWINLWSAGVFFY